MITKTISKTTPALVTLLMLTIISLFMPHQIIAYPYPYPYPIAKPGCQDTCGGIEIPYPFGIGPNCSLPGFEISCKKLSDRSKAPFLLDNIPVVNILINQGQIRVNHSITSLCYNQENSSMTSETSTWNFQPSTPYWISQQNKFFVIGCDVIANISLGNGKEWQLQSGCSTLGCDSPDSITNLRCNGTAGCCDKNLPADINSYEVTLQNRYYNSSKQHNTTQCDYAFLTEVSEYGFYYTTMDKVYKKEKMPVFLDWSIGNESCATAQAHNSYACISKNTRCYDASNTRNPNLRGGYNCYCSYGNPYLVGGCPGLSLSLSVSL